MVSGATAVGSDCAGRSQELCLFCERVGILSCGASRQCGRDGHGTRSSSRLERDLQIGRTMAGEQGTRRGGGEASEMTALVQLKTVRI